MSLAKMHNTQMLWSETETEGAEREETKREHTTETGQPGTVDAKTIYREIGLLLPSSKTEWHHQKPRTKKEKSKTDNHTRTQTHTHEKYERRRNKQHWTAGVSRARACSAGDLLQATIHRHNET